MAKILIIEDDDAISTMLALNFKVAGYEYAQVWDGEEALRIIKQSPSPDLIILDLMLPGIDGIKLLETVKTKEIPTIVVTAVDNIDTKIKALTGGADDYIVKPFEILELMVRVEKTLKRNLKPAKKISIGDIDIDLEKMTVSKESKFIELMPTEYKLLITLLQNRGKAISREQLLSMVWGDSYNGETRTVDVHIAKLRKKLNLENVILTVHKYGYKIQD